MIYHRFHRSQKYLEKGQILCNGEKKRRRAGNWGTYSSLSLRGMGKRVFVTSRGGPCVHSKINSRSINLFLVASRWYAVDILPWIQAYFFDFLFSKNYQKDKSR